ncbi:MAG: hypothetical protein V9E93_16395 [Steroidobacteraceae bacterium]
MIAIDAIDSGSNSSAALVIDAFRMDLSISASLTSALPSTVPPRSRRSWPVLRSMDSARAAAGNCSAAANCARKAASAAFCAPSELTTPTAISKANWRSPGVSSGVTTCGELGPREQYVAIQGRQVNAGLGPEGSHQFADRLALALILEAVGERRHQGHRQERFRLLAVHAREHTGIQDVEVTPEQRTLG